MSGVKPGTEARRAWVGEQGRCEAYASSLMVHQKIAFTLVGAILFYTEKISTIQYRALRSLHGRDSRQADRRLSEQGSKSVIFGWILVRKTK